MDKNRIEAFSDGVIAILITIMVLELKTPDGATWHALKQLAPVLASYVLSFVFLGIYWNNHHHMFQLVERVNGKILWANLHLLFWLSLVPFGTTWLGNFGSEAVPTAVYGVILFCAGVAYYVLQQLIIADQGAVSHLAAAVGNDFKGRASPVFYAVGIGAALLEPWISDGLYAFVALMWLIPDRRIESRLH